MNLSTDTLKLAAEVFEGILMEHGEDGIDSLYDALTLFRSGKTVDDYTWVFCHIESDKVDVFDVGDEIAALAAKYEGEELGGGSGLFGMPNRDVDFGFPSEKHGREFVKRFNATFGRRKTLTKATAEPRTVDSLEDVEY